MNDSYCLYLLKQKPDVTVSVNVIITILSFVVMIMLPVTVNLDKELYLSSTEQHAQLQSIWKLQPRMPWPLVPQGLQYK